LTKLLRFLDQPTNTQRDKYAQTEHQANTPRLRLMFGQTGAWTERTINPNCHGARAVHDHPSPLSHKRLHFLLQDELEVEGIVPGASYETEDVLAALERSLGRRVALNCNRFGHLQEVHR
jgi:hypothetical protein